MWQEEFKQSYRTARDLVRAELIDSKDEATLEPVLAKYGFLLPRYYASLIDRNNPKCPIRLQALPQLDELAVGESADPLHDLGHQPEDRITHRFKGRVLLHLTSNCSMYCRFCFRKSLLNEMKTDLFSGSLESGLRYIERDASVEEVIFSGGDPFMVSDEALREVMDHIKTIKHVRRVRFHTRVPVTFPMRVTDGLVQSLKVANRQVVVVTHFNHPKELTSLASESIHRMGQAGFTLLNQSVLLKDVNDSSDILEALSQGLFKTGILPYYLHQRDKAEGTQHFEVPVEEGKKIYSDLKNRLPGYLVPRYVQDLGDSRAKTDL